MVADAFCDMGVALVGSRRVIDISGLRDALEGFSENPTLLPPLNYPVQPHTLLTQTYSVAIMIQVHSLSCSRLDYAIKAIH